MLTMRTAAGDAERGASLVVVMIVMFALTTVAIVVAGLVMSTMTSAVGARSTAQSRSAADAGLAVAVSEAATVGGYCPSKSNFVPETAVSIEETATYKVETVCGADRVTFKSTGKTASGGETVTEAVYRYFPVETPGTGADMIFFANTKFTEEVVSHAGVNGELLSLVIPGGGFTCQADVQANIIASGNFTTSGSCDVKGDVHVNGTYTSAQNDTQMRGNVTAAGTGTHRASGTIDKGLDVGGDLSLVSGGKVLGDVNTAGVVTTAGTIGGTLTQNGTAPPKLDFTALGFSWFDYAYASADWGFAEHKLTSSGSGAGTCKHFNNWPGAGWTDLTTQTVSGPVAIDARSCSNLSSNMGTNPVVTLSNDVVIAAKSFDLTKLTINAAPGKTPRVWIIVDDAKTPGSPFCTSACVKNETPNIPSGGGTIKINGTVIGANVAAMAYTPGEIDVAGMGNDAWRGALYGGSFDYGGGVEFWGAEIALPGQVGGSLPESGGGTPATMVLGERISQRDVP